MSTRCPMCCNPINEVICSEIRAGGLRVAGASIITMSCPRCRELLGTQIVMQPQKPRNKAGWRNATSWRLADFNYLSSRERRVGSAHS